MNWGRATARFFLIIGILGIARFQLADAVDIIKGTDTVTEVHHWAASISVALTATAWTFLTDRRDNVDKANDQPH